MAKKIVGVTALLLGLVGLFFAIVTLCLKTSLGASENAHDAQLGVKVNEARIEGLQIDIRRVQTEQMTQNQKVQTKLDRLLERTP